MYQTWPWAFASLYQLLTPFHTQLGYGTTAPSLQASGNGSGQGPTSVEGHRCRDLATASIAFGKVTVWAGQVGFGQGTNITASSTNSWTDPKI